MIGLVTLGHSPRPDHEEVYDKIVPGMARILRGALDSFSCEEAKELEDKSGFSPLVCLLKNGDTVEIPLPVLFPYLQDCVEELARKGAVVAVILCSGGFPSFEGSSIPVLLPGSIVPAVTGAILPSGKIGIVIPNAAQKDAAVNHWKKILGRDVVSTVFSPYKETGFEETVKALAGCDLVSLDCMGFNEEHRKRLAEACGVPVLLPKALVAHVAGEFTTASC